MVLLHGFASYANAVSSSHTPALWHHDHEADGGGSHDAADHSHDKTSLPHGEPHAAPPSDQDRTAGLHHRPYPLLSFSFERPPRQ
jgi:hypothetical protein